MPGRPISDRFLLEWRREERSLPVRVILICVRLAGATPDISIMLRSGPGGKCVATLGSNRGSGRRDLQRGESSRRLYTI
jgi:hypothetical protein